MPSSVAVTGTNGSGYGGVLSAPNALGYDLAERKISGTCVLGTVTHGLDANGNRTSLTYPNGTVIPTQFDELNRPGLTLGFGATAGAGIITTRFDRFDRPYSTLLGSIWYMNSSYDLGNHQINTAFNGQGLDLTRVFDYQGATGVYSDFRYGFDQAHKLAKTTTFPATAIIHPVSGNTLAGLAANTSNEVQTTGSTLTYNADGNLTGDGIRSYTYDADGTGRILSATNSSTGSTTSYQFDAFGRRIAKTVNGTTTQYLLDNRGNEVGEYTAAGGVKDYLVYDPYQTAPRVSLDPNGNASFYEVDRLGSVVATSSGSTLANTYAYLPYGDTPSGTIAGTSFGYAGYRFDAETGTYHTRSRSYDPRLGRFLQTDPIGQQGGVNIYAYVTNDPLSNSDIAGTQPTGTQGQDDTSDELGGAMPGGDDTSDELGGVVPGSAPAPAPAPPSFNPAQANTGASSPAASSTLPSSTAQGPAFDPSEGIDATPPATLPSPPSPTLPQYQPVAAHQLYNGGLLGAIGFLGGFLNGPEGTSLKDRFRAGIIGGSAGFAGGYFSQ